MKTAVRSGIFVMIIALAAGNGLAGDAVELLRSRDGLRAGYVDLSYHNAPLQRILFDLKQAKPGMDIAVKAESLLREQDVLAEALTIGPLRGLSWGDAVSYVAGTAGLVVDRSRQGEGVVDLVETARFTGVFDGVRLGDAIRLIIERAAANVVVSPKVKADAPVFLTFNDVPWRDALASVLKAYGCTMETAEGGIVRVLTLDEAPVSLKTVSRPLRYLQPGAEQLLALQDVLKNIVSGKGAAGYERVTNSLVLTDTADKVAEMLRLVDAIDLAPYQVAIEASIIDMDMSPEQLVAANWLVQNAPSDCGDGGFVWEAVCSLHGSSCAAATAAMAEPLASSTYSQGTLSTAEAAAVIQASLFSDAVTVTQAPQMTVLDRERAEVAIGSARAGAESFAGVRLAVVPQVCGDGDQVMLEICYEQHGEPAACGNMVRVVRTKMLLHSGETGIIAGLLADAPGAPVRKYGRAPVAKAARRHSVILVTPVLMTPPDDHKFELGVEALRESLAL